MKNKKVQMLVFGALFSAIAFVLYLFEIPFFAHLKFDLSDIPALLGSILFTPVFGVVVELVKNLLQLAVRGLGSTMGFGNIMNFLVGVAYIVPFALVWRKLQKGKDAAVSGKPTPNSPIYLHKRSVEKCFLFTILTCGHYLIYWKYLLVKNTKAIRNDKSGCAVEVLCLTFVPFYSLYWWYTRGKAAKDEFAQKGYSTTGNETIYLILDLLGLGIVSMAIMQNDFNTFPSEEIRPNRRIVAFILAAVCGIVSILVVGVIGNALIVPPYFRYFMHFVPTNEQLKQAVLSATALNALKGGLLTVVAYPLIKLSSTLKKVMKNG